MPSLPVLATLLASVLLAACAGTPPQQSPDRTAGVEVQQAPRGVDGRRVEVVAVGDLVCPPGSRVTTTQCRHRATARLTERLDPDAVLALGDLQYETGSLRAFRNAYARSWGDLRPITYPVPGNHEYRTPRAKGYFTYFDKRQPGRPGWYAVDLGRWRAYALNTNCSKVDCGRQAEWLLRDLRAHPRRCSLMMSHYPRYSSGEHGSVREMRRFFRIGVRHDVELMLSGHDHHYERFRPMNHRDQVRRRGMVQVVSGAGGKSHYPADRPIKGSAHIDDDTYGVLRLVLRPDSYRYGFRGIDGSRADEGTRACR